MQSLIAIVSCNRDIHNGFNQAIRDTWLKGFRGHYIFAVGAGSNTLCTDEWPMDCPDDYKSLPKKTYALAEWAYSEGYDHLFKCDTDTYARLDQILASNYHEYDYVGSFNGIPGMPKTIYNRLFPWASGGSGYWLSRRAMKILIDSGPPGSLAICPKLQYPCEDLWVGQVLGPYLHDTRLTAWHDGRYARSFEKNYQVAFTAHFCSQGMQRTFDTEWMHAHHRVNKDR